MERVFWLLLDRDGATVKNIMEEFQQSRRLSLPENHRKLVHSTAYCLHVYSDHTSPLAIPKPLCSVHLFSFCSCPKFYQLEQ